MEQSTPRGGHPPTTTKYVLCLLTKFAPEQIPYILNDPCPSIVPYGLEVIQCIAGLRKEGSSMDDCLHQQVSAKSPYVEATPSWLQCISLVLRLLTNLDPEQILSILQLHPCPSIVPLGLEIIQCLAGLPKEGSSIGGCLHQQDSAEASCAEALQWISLVLRLLTKFDPEQILSILQLHPCPITVPLGLEIIQCLAGLPKEGSSIGGCLHQQDSAEAPCVEATPPSLHAKTKRVNPPNDIEQPQSCIDAGLLPSPQSPADEFFYRVMGTSGGRDKSSVSLPRSPPRGPHQPPTVTILSRSLYVRSHGKHAPLPSDTVLVDWFSNFGDVCSCTIGPKHSAFVQMCTRSQAMDAISCPWANFKVRWARSFGREEYGCIPFDFREGQWTVPLGLLSENDIGLIVNAKLGGSKGKPIEQWPAELEEPGQNSIAAKTGEQQHWLGWRESKRKAYDQPPHRPAKKDKRNWQLHRESSFREHGSVKIEEQPQNIVARLRFPQDRT
ncbi:hypothetical protein PWT90_09540 [Aphanocladium album]|nr:hypothetical protein PWT90_09540 [Aphanocladium album]